MEQPVVHSMESVVNCMLVLLLVVACHVQAQASGNACSDGPSLCHSLVVYRAQAPNYLTLDSICALFGVSKLVIARANNLENENTQLVHGRALLVPITCGCRENVSQANVTYQTRGGDTFHSVVTGKFQNLVTHQAVMAANPEVDAYNLLDHTEVVMPIRCKCPTKAQAEKGITMLVTYVLHEGDTLAKIRRTHNANFQELVSETEPMALSNTSTTIFVPVSGRPLKNVSPSVAHLIPSPTSSKAASNDTLLLSLYIVVVGLVAVRLMFEIRYKFLALAKASKVEKKFSKCPESKRVDIEMGVQPELVGGSVWNCSDKPIMYSPQLVREATQNCSPLFHIQGSVYRGIINGRDVAIRRIKGGVSQELRSLQKVEHDNLVKLEGFCIASEGQSYLIYEYVDNSSLNLWLHKRTLKKGYTGLTWRTRLQIALDVATGLEYIHERTKPGIVHRDLKSSSVLLNSKLRAKIANVGVARSGINVATMHARGTEGYIAPEYGVYGLVSPKIDVFAFGVILLELISGKEAKMKDERAAPSLLWRQLKPLLEGEDREEKLRKWIDPNVQDTCHIDSAFSLALLARACLEEDFAPIPTIGEIVCKISDLLDVCFEHLEC